MSRHTRAKSSTVLLHSWYERKFIKVPRSESPIGTIGLPWTQPRGHLRVAYTDRRLPTIVRIGRKLTGIEHGAVVRSSKHAKQYHDHPETRKAREARIAAGLAA
jgi:hypothetical protein